MSLDDYQIDRNVDDFLKSIIPWGYLDIRACVTTAMEIDMRMEELADLILEYQRDVGAEIEELDINAILNRHILWTANDELVELISYDLEDEDIYFYENYMDCRLQYKEEQAEEILKLLKRNEVEYEDLNKCTQYVLSEMGIEPWK